MLCNEFWCFVLLDLGFVLDVYESMESGIDMFMSILRSYLEKEIMFVFLIVIDIEVDLLYYEVKR